MLNKDTIIEMLRTDDRAVARALLVLTARQTADEQASEQTRYLNGRGYRPCHARMGASMSKFFERNGYLSPKQIAYWRAKDRTGSMRIGIYWAQLLEEAQIKAAKKAEQKAEFATAFAAQNFPPVKLHDFGARGPVAGNQDDGRDYGNDMERRMVLEYELGDVMDSDDPALIEPIAKEIEEIDAFWKKIQDLNSLNQRN